MALPEKLDSNCEAKHVSDEVNAQRAVKPQIPPVSHDVSTRPEERFAVGGTTGPRVVNTAAFNAAAKKVFEKHAGLLRRLAE